MSPWTIGLIIGKNVVFAVVVRILALIAAVLLKVDCELIFI